MGEGTLQRLASCRADYQSVLTACFESERFRFDFEGGAWLLPDSSHWSVGLREARERLAGQRDLWKDGVPFVRELLDGDLEDNRWYSFLRLGTDMVGNVYSLLGGYASFVRATRATVGVELASEIEEFIDQHYFYDEVPVVDLRDGKDRNPTFEA